jgi:hypothetical protein
MIISGVKDFIRIDIGHIGYYVLMGLVGGISKVMIGGFISGLLLAYLLTFLKVDHFIIDILKELFKYDMGTGGYYLLFAVLGAAVSFLKIVRTLLKPIFFVVKRK